MSTYYNPFQPGFGRSARPRDEGAEIADMAINDSLKQESAANRQASRDAARAARVDPVKEAIGALSTRRADLGRMRTALRNELDGFVKTEGANLFEPDDSEFGLDGQPVQKFRRDPVTKQPVLKWGPDGSASQKMMQLRQRAATDPLARAELAQQEEQFSKSTRLAIEKYKRYQAELARIDAAEQEAEGQLGQFAAARQGWEPAASPFAAPPVAPSSSASAAQPTTANPDSTPAPAAPPAAAPGMAAIKYREDGRITPKSIIRLHEMMKIAEEVSEMDTATDKLKQGQRTKAEQLRAKVAEGIAAYADQPATQKLITDAMRDPTFMERVGNSAARVAEGLGGGLVDMGQFATRQAVRGLNAVGADINPDENIIQEFLTEMRNTAGEWGPNVSKEVEAKLREGLDSQISQAVGSTLSFVVPTTAVLRLARLTGATPKALTVLARVTPAVLGASQNAQSTREEAKAYFEQLVEQGQMSSEDARTGINQAEFWGAMIGTTEAISPAGRFAQKIARVPAGNTFLREMAKRAGNGGTRGVINWLRGEGRRYVVDVLSEAGEEGFQEMLQGYLSNRVARGDFGNTAYDPDRDLGEGLVEGAGIGAMAGALISSLLRAYGSTSADRQKRIAAAMERARQQAPASGDAGPEAPAPTPSVSPTPSAPAPAPVEPEAQDDVTANPESGAPAEAFVFVDAKTGRTLHVPANGLREATTKLPAGFVPDPSKTRMVSAGQAPGQSVPAVPAPTSSAPVDTAPAPTLAPDNREPEIPAPAVAEAPSSVVAQPGEQQSPKLPVAGSTPAGAASLTPEAEQLLAQIDKGGAAPAFISRNLERIANENGVEITPQMRPDDVVSAIRARRDSAPAAAPSAQTVPEPVAPAADSALSPQPTAIPADQSTPQAIQPSDEATATEATPSRPPVAESDQPQAPTAQTPAPAPEAGQVSESNLSKPAEPLKETAPEVAKPKTKLALAKEIAGPVPKDEAAKAAHKQEMKRLGKLTVGQLQAELDEKNTPPALRQQPGPFAQAVLDGREEEFLAAEEAEEDARRNAPLDPDAIGGANNPIAEREETAPAAPSSPEPRATPETTPTGVEQTPRVVEQTPRAVSPAPAFEPTAAGLIALRRRIGAGEATPAEIKAAWETLKANKPALQKDLASMTKDQLMRFAGISARASDSKAELVRSAISTLQFTFVAGDSLSYGLTAGMTQEKAIDEQMDKWTPEVIAKAKADMDARVEAAKQAVAAKEKALTNPETLEEFQRFAYAAGAKAINAEGKAAIAKARAMKDAERTAYIRSRGLDAFTPEQRATYDALLAESTRGQREADAARTKTVEAVALPEGAQFSEIIETKHTQKGHDLFVVQLNTRVEREAYDTLNTRAKRLGGSYSSYNKGGAIPGFQFRTRDAAEQFRSGERVDGAERVAAKQENRRGPIAARLRELAQKQIDAGNESLSADRKTNTAKRAGQAASAEASARAQIRIGETMKNLADAIEANEVTFIDRITTKAHVEEMERMLRKGQLERVQKQADAEQWNYNKRESARQAEPTVEDAGFAKFPMPYFQLSSLMQMVATGRETEGAKLAAQRVQREVIQQMPQDRGGAYAQSMAQAETVRELAEKLKPTESNKWGPANTTLAAFDSMDRLARMEIKTEAELRAALREFAQYRGTAPKADPVKAMERELIGKQLPGFFPTPPALAREVVDRAGIADGMSVLEPSAGKGDLADTIKEAHPDAKLTVIEYNRTLTPILEAKGYAPKAEDFLDHRETYDRIVMNPPFENGQDIDHVRHAYSLLKPGGKLVAIMSAGPFGNSAKKAQEFRAWLESLGGVAEKNPDGSFAGADAFRQTGVSTYTVEISKAAEAPATTNVAPADGFKPLGITERTLAKQKALGQKTPLPAMPITYAGIETQRPSFSATRKALLAQVDEAIPKAVAAEGYKRDAMLQLIKEPGYRQPTNAKTRAEEAERIAARATELAEKASGGPVVFKAGTSTYRIANTREALEKFRKVVAAPLRAVTNPGATEGKYELDPVEMEALREALDKGTLDTPAGRALLDAASKEQLAKLKLDDRYTRVAPGVVLTKEAAQALADLKAGKQTEFDVQASIGDAVAMSDLDPTYPAELKFVDATEGDYSPANLAKLSEFERSWNAQRATEGKPAVRFIAQSLADDSRGSVGLRGVRQGEPDSPGVGAVSASGNRGSLIFVRALGAALKKHVIFFKSDGDSGLNGATSTEHANTILVNVNARAPLAAIIGHEVGHNIAAQNRVLWTKMRDIILQVAGQPPAEYEATKRAQNYDTNEKILNEWVSDFLGQRFDEAEFWQEVARIADTRQETQTLKTFARSAFEWITDLGRKLRRVLTKFADRNYVARIEEVRRGLAQVLTDYVAQMPEAGYPDNPDATPAQKLKALEASQGPAETIVDAPEINLSQSPRTERSGGNVVTDQEYEVRSHDLLLDEAEAHEKAVGETQALADALDRGNRKLRDDTKEAIRFRAMKRISAKILDAATSENEQIALARELQRISSVGNDQTRERAQAQSARQLYGRDQRVASPVQLLDENRKRQERAIGDDGKGVVDDAEKEIDRADREAGNKVAEEAKAKADQLDIGLPVWEEYRNDAAQRMVEMIDQRTSLPEPKAALADFTDRVIAEMRRRIEPSLPDTPASEQVPPTPMEVLKEAIENREKYAEVFETVREEFVKEFGEGSTPVEMIDIELGNMGVRPYSAETLQKAINEAIEAMSLKVSELARQHVTKTDRTAADLAKALVGEAGLKPADAKRLAADLEKTARDAIQQAREEAIARLKQKHERSSVRAKKVAGALAKITELNNLGMLTRGDLMDLVAKELKLPRVSPEQIRKVARMADAVENATDGLTKARLQWDLMNEIRVIRGIGAADIGLSVWMANLLSGPMTHVANVTSNALLSTINLASVMATNPRSAKFALEGWLSGFETGWAEGRDIMRSGRSIREMGDAVDLRFSENTKAGEMGNVLEAVDYSRDFPKLPRALATGLQKHANVMRYVSRAMRAADAVFYYPAREGYSRVVTAKLLEGQYQGKELFQKVRESLGIAPDQFVRYEKQAEGEGWKGLDKALRVAQLIEEQRKSTLTGISAQAEAEQFGRESTINQDPVGIAGAVYRRLRDLNTDLPAMRVFLPFLRVPTNLFNESLNYSPLGFVRGFRGMRDETGKGMKMFNESERAILYFKAWAGSLAMMGMTALALSLQGDDDEEPMFTITATGPGDFKKRQQLEATGWKEFSVKIGNVWISYKDSPLILPFAAVGRVVDSVRYQTARETAEDRNPYLDALMLYPSVLFETSMLTGLSTLMEVSTASSADAAASRFEQFLSNTAANVVVPNAARQVDRIIDPTAYQTDGVLGRFGAAVPFARQTGTVRTDVLGEEVERSPLKRFVSVETDDALREALRAKNVFIPTPSRSTKIGNRTMTEDEYRVFFRLYGEGMNRTLRAWETRIPGMDAERVEKLVKQVADRERERAKRQVVSVASQSRT